MIFVNAEIRPAAKKNPDTNHTKKPPILMFISVLWTKDM